MAIEYWTMVSDSLGNRFGGVNLISVHFKKLSLYKDEWTIEDILVFELLLVLSRGFGGDDFFHQMRYLEKKTRLTKYRINKSLDKLKSYGFVDVDREGKFGANIYNVNYDAITSNLDLIYDFSKLKKQDVQSFKDRMCNFFDYYKSYQIRTDKVDQESHNYEPESLIAEDDEDDRELTMEEMFSPEFIAEMEAIKARNNEKT